MAGRPTIYTEEIAKKIFTQLAEGESLRKICLQDEMPAKQTVLNWIVKVDGFVGQYENAKKECAQNYAEEIVAIADDGTNDWMQSNDPDNPGYKVKGEHIQRSRLRVDARKWVASKLLPKKYGDKVDVNHGGQKDNPLTLLLEEINGKSLGIPDSEESSE